MADGAPPELVGILVELGERALHVAELARRLDGDGAVDVGTRAGGARHLVVAEPAVASRRIGRRRRQPLQLLLQPRSLRQQVPFELLGARVRHGPILGEGQRRPFSTVAAPSATDVADPDRRCRSRQPRAFR
jgi:hypothetical protein